ncbi:hypothetical protein AA0X95_11115 [Bacillus sp. 1P10SD]|uniref:hypothetical protein n=1 Tax=Bacillus sp. 1P10SD TaxID=3132265 RepID=UPI0039A58B7C
MENKIVCFSASSKNASKNHYKTVESNVMVSDILKYIEQMDESLEGIKNLSMVSIWALGDSKKKFSQWSKLRCGDLAVFYSNKKFISYGEIIGLIANNKIAKFLWDDETYKYIVIMKPNTIINSSRERLWGKFGYSNKATIQGMMIPNIKRQNDFLKDYNDLYSFMRDIM